MFDPGIERALRAAVVAHAGQTRKGSSLPYATHPVHVALILVRIGAPRDAVQAGLLHDVVEDCEDWTFERVREEFGDDVAEIVSELTEDKSKGWEERKRTAAEKVPAMSAAGVLVKAADQLHNLCTLKESLEGAEDRSGVWASFKGGREGTLQMAELLLEALTGRCDPRITEASAIALSAIREQDE